MSKYIPADKLIAEIKKLKRSVELNREHYNNTSLESRNDLDAYYAQELILNSLIDTITSLQQEQPELPPIGYAETYYQKGLHDGIIKGQMEILKGLEEIEKRKAEPVLVIKGQEQQVLPGIEAPGIPGKDFIPVEWVDACEMYGKWKIVKQEQPEADLEKEIEDYWEKICDDEFGELIPRERETVWFDNIARHFWFKGYNARKEE